MSAFQPKQIKQAPDRIAQLRGFINYQYFADHQRTVRMMLKSLGELPDHPKSDDLLISPYNYLREPAEYLALEITLRLMVGDRKELNGLQLAANYGPYLLYLREVRGFRNFTGIDIDQYAIQYAQEINNPVAQASATALPSAEASQDVVFSDHFLTLDYQPLGRKTAQDLPAFIGSVAAEIYRVLKPGGLFISLDECVHVCDTPFDRPQTFSPEVGGEIAGLRTIRVFQKAA